MSKVRMFINGLVTRKKLSGTSALSKTLLDMAKVVADLDSTLDEANGEAQDQADRVRVAKVELDRIENLIDKGETFLTGLKSLFGITD